MNVLEDFNSREIVLECSNSRILTVDMWMEEAFSTRYSMLNQSTVSPWYVIRMAGGVGGKMLSSIPLCRFTGRDTFG